MPKQSMQSGKPFKPIKQFRSERAKSRDIDVFGVTNYIFPTNGPPKGAIGSFESLTDRVECSPDFRLDDYPTSRTHDTRYSLPIANLTKFYRAHRCSARNVRPYLATATLR
ncbi:hypothetical protein EC9_20910 [Rosistilla ulvae]|uniref:Uncharacterized protein n=1 Tax=Rosistilla ulvae TaxID=1930277 RepID=A0A517LZ65_9BACT|nr:hypothetical protein EC9_20910 [Rosistilla ulvae]